MMMPNFHALQVQLISVACCLLPTNAPNNEVPRPHHVTIILSRDTFQRVALRIHKEMTFATAFVQDMARRR